MYQLDCQFWSQKFHIALLVWRHECNRNGPFYPIISERIKFQFFHLSECLHNNSISIKNEIELSKIIILFFKNISSTRLKNQNVVMTKKRAKMKMIAVEVQAKSPMIQLSVSKIILLLFCWFKIMNFILISSNSCLYLQRLRKWQKNKWTKWKSYCLFKNFNVLKNQHITPLLHQLAPC